MQRVLSVSLPHVIRSATFLLLPFAFIALIAWATAGSASGSTTDPIRGAVWLWLGAHHIPFQLAMPPTGIAGYLTFLPLGAILLPFFAIRAAFNRAVDRLQGDFHDINAVRLIFSTFYALGVTALSYLSKSDAVAAQWYLAPLIAFLIALVATMTAGQRISFSRPLKIAARSWALLLGTALIAVAILIITDFDQVKKITISLQPGFFGGFLLLFLNILYLPNAAIALLAYFSGTGLAVGAETLISPLSHHLGQIPALPLLGILPTQQAPFALLAILLFIALGVLIARWTFEYGVHIVIQSYIFTIVGATLFGYLSSGSLITSEMGAMGVSIWKFALSLAVEIGIGVAITTYFMSRKLR